MAAADAVADAAAAVADDTAPGTEIAGCGAAERAAVVGGVAVADWVAIEGESGPQGAPAETRCVAEAIAIAAGAATPIAAAAVTANGIAEASVVAAPVAGDAEEQVMGYDATDDPVDDAVDDGVADDDDGAEMSYALESAADDADPVTTTGNGVAPVAAEAAELSPRSRSPLTALLEEPHRRRFGCWFRAMVSGTVPGRCSSHSEKRHAWQLLAAEYQGRRIYACA